MPPARSSTYARRSSRPVRVQSRFAVSRVRWDRKFRTLMLMVLALVGWIGVHGMLTLIHTRAQAEHELQQVAALAAQNRRLAALQKSLRQPATIKRDARALGMVGAGERSYVVTGVSNGS